MSPDPRRVLLVAHTARHDARDLSRALVERLHAHRIVVRMLSEEAADLGLAADPSGPLELVNASGEAGVDCELVVVVGGDGSILRAAEMAHPHGIPVLGVNIGHVGFLAEAEVEDVEATIEAIASRRYTTDERLTLDVTVQHDGEVVARTFALNEASVEKAARERMLEVVLEIDGPVPAAADIPTRRRAKRTASFRGKQRPVRVIVDPAGAAEACGRVRRAPGRDADPFRQPCRSWRARLPRPWPSACAGWPSACEGPPGRRLAPGPRGCSLPPSRYR